MDENMDGISFFIRHGNGIRNGLIFGVNAVMGKRNGVENGVKNGEKTAWKRKTTEAALRPQ